MSDEIASDDRGFLYGDGLFETVRVEDGEPRFLDRHRARFSRSARALSFPESAIKEGLEALGGLQGRRDGLWRVTVTRPGDGSTGGGSGVVQVRWRDFPYAVDETTGPTLMIVEDLYFPEYWLAEHKTTSWLRSLEARRQAVDAGFDEALMVSPDGRIGEAAAANVFLLIDGTWVTPPIEGILPGVVRAEVIEAARRENIEIEERAVFVGDLYTCEAMALTSTGRLVTAVSAIENITLESVPVSELENLLSGTIK